MSKDDLFFRIRLPEALKNEIQRLAVGNHRSANAEIVARLIESIDLGLNGSAPSTPEEKEAGLRRKDNGFKVIFSNPLFGEEFRAGVLKIMREEAQLSKSNTAAKKPPTKRK